MPSERRLHPASILFALSGSLKTFALPAVLLLFSSLRGGSVVGDHSVVFAANGERIELVHRADDRAIFARGAVQAALWLAGQKPGRYAMDSVLGV